MCIFGNDDKKQTETQDQTTPVHQLDFSTLPPGTIGGYSADGSSWALRCEEGKSPIALMAQTEGTLDFNAELAARGLSVDDVQGGAAFDGKFVGCVD